MSPCLVTLKLTMMTAPSGSPLVLTVAAPAGLSAPSLRSIQADYGHEVGRKNQVTREPFSVLAEGGVGAEGRECTALVCSDQLLESQRSFQGAVQGGVGWGPLEHFPRVDEALGTRVSHKQLDVRG